MKIENKSADTIKIGQTASKQATISEHKISKLQYILTKGLYSDPITAVIAEITNNGIDAVVQAGKDPKKFPVLVEIDKNEQGNYFFRVTDKGTGLDQNQFENILMNYLESTKEEDSNSIGFFGLGSKSFLGLDRAATFTCRKNGKELKYLAYQGAEFCEYDLISEKDTKEENGVIFEIPIEGYSEMSQFCSKARQKLAYYDTVALMIYGRLEPNKITRSKDWQYSEQNKNTTMHLCLKDVYYQIDFGKLGINSIEIPIALRFGLQDGITVTPSRENLIYTEKVKTIIKEKIAAVAEWFVKKYNDTVPDEYDSILEVWNDIDNDKKIVEVNSVEFKINSLIPHSGMIAKWLKVKGLVHRNPSWYKQNAKLMLSDYTTVLHKRMGGNIRSEKKAIRYTLAWKQILDGHRVVLVDAVPLGYMRKYLHDKYDKTDCTFVTKPRQKTLKKKNLLADDESWHTILLLNAFNKKEWRSRIAEFQRVEKEFIDKIVDERNVENTQHYKDWVEKHKAFVKANQKPGSSNYRTLNKQNGDITLSIARTAKNDSSVCVFEKNVFKINELYKQPTLFVQFDDEDEAKKHWPVLRKSSVTVCMIGKKEITKLPLFSIKKFIKFEEFMSRDYKPFLRIASSILFSKTIDDFEEIKEGKGDLFKNCMSAYYDDYLKLKAYVDENFSGTDEDIVEAILAIAEEKDLFDKQLWDVYLRLKKAVEKLDFVTCFEVPRYWDEAKKKKYNRVINQMLLFQKKYYDLEGYELVKKSEPAPLPTKLVITDEGAEEVEEELELEETF